MGKTDTRESELIGGYVAALLGVARGEGVLDQVEQGLGRLKEVLKTSQQMQKFLMDPRVTSEGRRKGLAQILGEGVSPIVLSQIGLMIEQGRGGLILKVVDEFFKAAAAARGKVTAQVKTAVPLTAETEKRLEEVLSKLAGRRVFLKTSVDPTLLGGVVVRLGGRIIDGSVKGRLERLRAGISKGL